jgi:hypothetical protein
MPHSPTLPSSESPATHNTQAAPGNEQCTGSLFPHWDVLKKLDRTSCCAQSQHCCCAHKHTLPNKSSVAVHKDRTRKSKITTHFKLWLTLCHRRARHARAHPMGWHVLSPPRASRITPNQTRCGCTANIVSMAHAAQGCRMVVCAQAQLHLVAAMPAVSMVRGLLLITLRTPPKPQVAPTDRPMLEQQSPTKAATQRGREEGAGSSGLRHCGNSSSSSSDRQVGCA